MVNAASVRGLRTKPFAKPVKGQIADLVDLAQQEFEAGRYAAAAIIARLVRSRAPDEWEPQRLLSLVAAAPDYYASPSAEFFYAIGKAHHLLGENELAAPNYRQAVTLNRNLWQAHVGLASLRMHGDPIPPPITEEVIDIKLGKTG